MQGVSSAKRVRERIHGLQRNTENTKVVENLKSRVTDWKGHHVQNFGELVLQNFFNCMKSGIERKYFVFLFEKILAIFKEDTPPTPKVSRRRKSSSKPLDVLSLQRKHTLLLFKGRIFVSNLLYTQTTISNGNVDATSWLNYTHRDLKVYTTSKSFGRAKLTQSPYLYVVQTSTDSGAGRNKSIEL
jgi:hypothetical protein